MKIIQNGDIGGVDVQVLAVHEHRWPAGERLHHEPPIDDDNPFIFHLWFIQQGYVTFQIDEKRRVKSGELCLLPASLERDIFTPQPASWISLRLSITVFNKFNLLKNISLPAQWQPDDAEKFQMESWMTQIIREFRTENDYHRLVVNGLAQALFGLCWPHLTSKSLIGSIHSELPDWLAQTMRRISDDPSCTVATLAHEAGFSPAQFRRAFHQQIGTAPRDYLHSYRFEAACHYLRHTDLPVRTIVERIGLRNVNHFSQIFKDIYGMPPSHYRVSQRKSEI